MQSVCHGRTSGSFGGKRPYFLFRTADLAVLANSRDRCPNAFPIEMLAYCQLCPGFARVQKVKMVPFGDLLLWQFWDHDLSLIGTLIGSSDKVVFLVGVSVDFLVVQFAGSTTIH
jgi:hypothetical protein